MTLWTNRESREQRVWGFLEQNIRTGDVVWDVGANRGEFTKIFSVLVGSTGFVCAFEPHPATYSLLCSDTPFENTKHYNIGLSNQEARVPMTNLDSDKLNRLIDASITEANAKLVQVNVMSGDRVIKEGKVKQPTVVKIDVEGEELEVLAGMQETLQTEALRVLVVEIHRQALEARYQDNAVKLIKQMIGGAGFRVSWLDSSHLLGTRTTKA